jgi:hypothetical protein
VVVRNLKVSNLGFSLLSVSKKSQHIAKSIEKFRGRELDAHYLAYFECFDRQLFYEAHDVLEQLWLADRHGPDGDFYKGLIQLAGAFVHVQKDRPGPAQALLHLAFANLAKYPSNHRRLDVSGVLYVINDWSLRLKSVSTHVADLVLRNPPALTLTEAESRAH